ncbi:MAG: hypothetical protein ACYTHK_18665 [Planctomycetota bacterium]|jgi:hypothetical protein
MTIVILPAKDRTLDFVAVRRELAREGVRPGRMLLVADGVVEDETFRINGWPAAYPLTSALPAGPRRLRASVLIHRAGIKLRPADEPPAGL